MAFIFALCIVIVWVKDESSCKDVQYVLVSVDAPYLQDIC